MTLRRLEFKAGLNRDQTSYAGRGGYWDCDKIRFRSSYPEKLGGWIKYLPQPLIGTCRQLYTYSTTFYDNFLMLGTSSKLYLEAGGNLIDITPIRATFVSPATNNCFTTTVGSNIVTVTINGHGANTGDYVNFLGAASVGGIPASDLNSSLNITNVINANSFQVAVADNATSAATGGGTAITARFEISVGPSYVSSGYGWGASAWGAPPWGLGAKLPITASLQRDWWLDNFYNDGLACYRNGPIFYWTYDNTFNSRAVYLASLPGAADVPTQAGKIIFSQIDRHLIAFGATPSGGGAFDPLLVRWSDQDNPQIFQPLETNSAGFYRLSRGNAIVATASTRQETLVFTDTALYSMQFLGNADVFGFLPYTENISILGPRAVTVANNITYWIGKDKFYVYTGRVETLGCTIRDYVFNDINLSQSVQVISGTNEQWNEVWWFYPSLTSNVPNKYVIYNYLEGIWYFGNLTRTAWFDSALRSYPIAVDDQNYVYYHEFGVNDDVNPMVSFIRTNDFDIAENAADGEHFILTKRIIPDISFLGSTADNPAINLTVVPKSFPGQLDPAEPLYPVIETTIDQYTNQVFLRTRSRQLSFEILSNTLGVQWQLGSCRLDSRPDGKR